MLKSTVLQFLLVSPIACIVRFRECEDTMLLIPTECIKIRSYIKSIGETSIECLDSDINILGWCSSLLSSLDEWIVSLYNGTRRIQHNRYSEHTIQQHSNTHPHPRDIFHSRSLIRHYSVLEMCTTN